jgi:hypothetical protein
MGLKRQKQDNHMGAVSAFASTDPTEAKGM